MRPLITEGHIYVGMPPLYKVTTNNKVTYCYTDEELENITKNLKQYNLQRYKGLGEMSAEQLWTTTMDPAKRSLMRVSIEDAVMADKEITMWMGDEVGPRKDYINKNANFNKVDSFELDKQMEKKKNSIDEDKESN